MPQRIKILIACHRPYPVPDEPCYLPVEVGAALHEQPIPGFTPDIGFGTKGDRPWKARHANMQSA